MKKRTSFWFLKIVPIAWTVKEFQQCSTSVFRQMSSCMSSNPQKDCRGSVLKKRPKFFFDQTPLRKRHLSYRLTFFFFFSKFLRLCPQRLKWKGKHTPPPNFKLSRHFLSLTPSFTLKLVTPSFVHSRSTT